MLLSSPIFVLFPSRSELKEVIYYGLITVNLSNVKKIKNVTKKIKYNLSIVRTTCWKQLRSSPLFKNKNYSEKRHLFHLIFIKRYLLVIYICQYVETEKSLTFRNSRK